MARDASKPTETDARLTHPGEQKIPAVEDKIVRRKLAHEVFDRLRAMITSGELAPGDPIPSERNLMQRFGVGRPAVREALQSMETMGLVTISHGGRSRVNALSPESVLERMDEVAQILLLSEPDQLEHLKEARRMFEMGMVRLAAERATDADISDLRTILEAQRACLDDPRSFIEADMRFHARIAEMTGNPIMGAASQAMLRWLLQYYTALLHWSGNEDTTLAEHEKIVALIAAHDTEGSVDAMRKHLDRSSDLFRHEGG
ncbi:transcriptional regulator NanR [Tropicimonas sp. IMCC6043]|uniref:transcriptional regulator NanR n=1 Tax=Tropicimonas sp. IMCC6043 TaxID=2510645 RepID=UPI00101D46CA|nr:transcriptional regulator NanR [Tropicimonas sp. IMCC6043]RYH08212.1 transcriptional regulator NanR [Tropicimonas sp. IMCC6043]